jgi:hypothetical protein
VSTAAPNLLKLFGETVAVYCEEHAEHIVNCVSRMRRLITLENEVHIATTVGLKG